MLLLQGDLLKGFECTHLPLLQARLLHLPLQSKNRAPLPWPKKEGKTHKEVQEVKEEKGEENRKGFPFGRSYPNLLILTRNESIVIGGLFAKH